MLTRDKLEYQKRLRFLREAKAKTASEELKLAKKAEESDLTKRMVTLGDEENRIPSRGETPKEYNETPKTGEESLVKDPVAAADKKVKKLDFDLDLMDVVQLKEAKGWYVFKVSDGPNDEPYDGLGLEMLDIEPQYYTDKAEAEVVADMLIDVEDSDFDVARVGSMMMEATPPQKDADQSLARHKKRKKATRTKSMKRKSHAKIKESNLEALLRECGCEMESPFDAPEDEPQGYMLVQNLEKLAKKAGELTGVAKYTDDAEPWVESKVNSAAEHIDAIYDYIKYGRNKKSDMNGQQDLHPPHHHDEMMNENKLRNMIRKIVLEQNLPVNLITGAPPPTTTPVTRAAAPAATARPGARPATAYRRGMSPEATGAINEIFSTDPTSRSLMNHLTRMLRGIQQNNAGVADGELANNSTFVNNTLRRRIPTIKTQRPDLSAAADELTAQINTFNNPPLPRALAQLTNKPQAVARIQALINWLTANRNRFMAPAPNATPDTSGTEPIVTEAEYRTAIQGLSQVEQQIARYITGIRAGDPDLSDTSQRQAYLQSLNTYAQQREGYLRINFQYGLQTSGAASALQMVTERETRVAGQISAKQAEAQNVANQLSQYGYAGEAAAIGSAIGGTAGAVGGLGIASVPGALAGAALGSAAGGLVGGAMNLYGNTFGEGVQLRNQGYAMTAELRMLRNLRSVLASIKATLQTPGSAPPQVLQPSGETRAAYIPTEMNGTASASGVGTPLGVTTFESPPSATSTPLTTPPVSATSGRRVGEPAL